MKRTSNLFLILMISSVSIAHAEETAVSIPEKVKAELKEADTNFTFKSRPINPLGIHLMQPWISDKQPPVSSIYIEGTDWDTNQFYATYKSAKDAMVCVQEKSGSFCYKRLGMLKNGFHVLETFQNDEGSGTWTDLLLVQFSVEPSYREDGSVEYDLALQRRGDVILGDRFNGDVVIQPDQIVIKNDGQLGRDTKEKTIHFK